MGVRGFNLRNPRLALPVAPPGPVRLANAASGSAPGRVQGEEHRSHRLNSKYPP